MTFNPHKQCQHCAEWKKLKFKEGSRRQCKNTNSLYCNAFTKFNDGCAQMTPKVKK